VPCVAWPPQPLTQWSRVDEDPVSE